MPVYASAETMAGFERVFEFAFKGTNPFPGYLKPEPHLVYGSFRLGRTTITPFPVPHGDRWFTVIFFTRDGQNCRVSERLQRAARPNCGNHTKE